MHNYIHAIVHGIVKIMSKMGISAVAGYQGAQVFEALGISQQVVDKYFTGTVSRIGGLELSHIAEETGKRHNNAYGAKRHDPLDSGGIFQYNADGEAHMYNPRPYISSSRLHVRETMGSLSSTMKSLKANRKTMLRFVRCLNLEKICASLCR